MNFANTILQLSGNNDLIRIIVFTVFLIGCFLAFYQFGFKRIGKEHYKTIDKAVKDGILVIPSRRDNVEQWIKRYTVNPSDSQINDTMKYLNQKHDKEFSQ